MLSKEAEKFLRLFRVEMMARGKKDDEMEEMEAELEDHLTEAEKDGKSIDDVTGGSVKEYLSSISWEMPQENHLKKWMTLFIIYMIGIFMTPSLISGSFDWTVSQFIYYALLITLGPLAIYATIKYIIVNHTDFKTEKIDKQGILTIILFSILYMGVLTGGLFLVNRYPVFELFTLQDSTNMIIGFILLGVIVITACIIKKYFYAVLAFALSLPNMIAQLTTGGSPDSEQYLIVSAVSLFIISIIIIFGMSLYTRRKNAENK